jgi:uncharacterized protein (TIGR03437 family)
VDGLAILTALATDSRGNLYVSEWLQHRIWRRSPAGEIATMAELGSGVARGLAVDSRGSVYYSDTSGVWKIPPEGAPQAVAGGLLGPGRLAVNAAGTVFVIDASALLRVDVDGTVRTVRGRGDQVVTALALDAAGNLYAGFIGGVARVAGDGSLESIAGTARCADAFRWPADLAVDAAGNLYFADPAGGRMRQIAHDGSLRSVAGGDGGWFGGDGGPAVNAFLAGPAAMAFDPAGNLYFVDSRNHRVRRIDPAGVIQTIAGSGPAAGEEEGCTEPANLGVSPSSGLATDTAGNLFISDTANNRVLQVSAGVTSTFVSANAPAGLAFGFGNLYIAEADRIGYMVKGAVDTFYGPLGNLAGLALDPTGNLFAGAPAGTVELAPGNRVFVLPGGGALAVGPRGEVYSAAGGSLSRLDSSCAVTHFASISNGDLRGVAVGPNGDVYASDAAANRIWRVPARPAGGGNIPLSLLTPASVVSGATLRPRTVQRVVRSRFGEITIFESANENVAPGEIVSIAGQCLGPLRFTQGPSDETQVSFDGVAAPLLSTTPNQLVAIVPYEIAGRSSTTMEVRYRDQHARVELQTAATSVGIFPVRNAEFARGSTVSLRITGAGAIDPSGRTVAPVQVTVAGRAAEDVSATAELVTFRIPQDLSAGIALVTIRVGDSSDSIQARIFEIA